MFPPMKMVIVLPLVQPGKCVQEIAFFGLPRKALSNEELANKIGKILFQGRFCNNYDFNRIIGNTHSKTRYSSLKTSHLSPFLTTAVLHR